MVKIKKLKKRKKMRKMKINAKLIQISVQKVCKNQMKIIRKLRMTVIFIRGKKIILMGYIMKMTTITMMPKPLKWKMKMMNRMIIMLTITIIIIKNIQKILLRIIKTRKKIIIINKQTIRKIINLDIKFKKKIKKMIVIRQVSLNNSNNKSRLVLEGLLRQQAI
jgi:hypothetical protein